MFHVKQCATQRMFHVKQKGGKNKNVSRETYHKASPDSALFHVKHPFRMACFSFFLYARAKKSKKSTKYCCKNTFLMI